MYLLLDICCSNVVVCILGLKCHQAMILSTGGLINMQPNPNICKYLLKSEVSLNTVLNKDLIL